MMRVRLPEPWVASLIRMPESGMGFQRVDITFSDGSAEKDCLVFNAEVIELPSDAAGKTIKNIRLHKQDDPSQFESA
jgi:hypothetical protein